MFTLPSLPYPYNALEPYIDEETVKIHHDKHHAAYVNNLNDALKGYDQFLAMDVNVLLTKLNDIPEAIRTKVKNNAGGHANHTLYWQVMAPKSGGEPTGKLSVAINQTFGNFADFKQKFSTAALERFGSGWVWLVVNKNKLEVVDTINQDSPISDGKKPILTLDIWEHAYYLKYRNMRADYINAWWNVISWKKVEKFFVEN